MKVYHGSYTAIETIDFSFFQIKRDFGKGFYVTKFYDQAEVWSKRKGKEHRSKPVITEFEFSEFFFRDEDFNVLRFDDYCNEWLDFVVLNRTNETEQSAHDYDIVEGPVADDKITTEVDRYIEGLISKEQFLNDLTHNPSHQICFCTMQSLQALSQPKGKIDIAVYDIGDKVVQSLMMDYNINEMEAADRYYTSNIYTQIADENTEFYKKTWQEIYEMLKQELK
ncbi:MAG: DUF3990 domain-containing protein [Flavobacteriaceae bacterium]|jgi:hypothetical protein|nr:DUF3990 domain-containing protein [Flavobacteriaceae bacterium]